MKLLNHIRSKTRLKNADISTSYAHHTLSPKTTNFSTKLNPTASFPVTLVEELLSYVCPHTRDDTYTTCEDSMVDGGCMLCDMKDLAQCALVNRQWLEAAQNLLYHNIRLDAVHYCDWEMALDDKRKRRSYPRRNSERPQERLQLLSRTVREDTLLVEKVQYLKISYMTREGSMADLARTISFLPNLRYVDLPDGVYNDEPAFSHLRIELLSRCRDIRHMKYNCGAESSFHLLTQEKQWPKLEALDLLNLVVEPTVIKNVLASLGNLREVKMSNLQLVDDTIFTSTSENSMFPSLVKLTLQDLPNISIVGLSAFLARPKTQETLKALTLINTGILPSNLHQILQMTPRLVSLHLTETVSRAFPSSGIQPLASHSLRTLHFEISSAINSPPMLGSPADSYYAYLGSSVLAGSLPCLSRLFVLSASLPNLIPPANRQVMKDGKARGPPSPLTFGISCPLQVYTKSVSEMEWELTLITPPNSANRRGSVLPVGPESLYNKPMLSPHWRDKGRESVMVGNGFGGFLAVPGGDSWPSPRLSEARKDSAAWMG